MALGFHGLKDIGPAAGVTEVGKSGSPRTASDSKPIDLARLGVRTAALSVTTTRGMSGGFARSLDVAPLAAILAEVDAARASAAASQAEAGRLETLYRQDVSTSRRSVETARAQALADSSRVRLAEQRIGLEFGAGLMRMGPGALRQLVSEIAAGRAALVRIDVPGADLPSGSAIEIGEPGAGMLVHVLGPAAVADARLQSAGVLAVVRGPMARQAQAGRILPARASSSGAVAGVLVPRDAIIRFQGRMWVFRQNGRKFDRVALTDPQPVANGWVVRDGLKADDVIATSGAAGLLALEAGGTASDAEE
jgi:hypothetical protein